MLLPFETCKSCQEKYKLCKNKLHVILWTFFCHNIFFLIYKFYIVHISKNNVTHIMWVLFFVMIVKNRSFQKLLDIL